MAQTQKASNVRPDNTVEAQGKSPIINVPQPGTVTPFDGIHFEGLGRLSEFPKATGDGSSTDAPVGEHVVVLIDYLLAPNRTSFTKGQVVQLSQVVRGYADPKVSDDEKRAELRRLFEIGALRLATEDEKGMDRVEVNAATETPEVRAEREKRIAAEARIKELEAKLGVNAGADGSAPEDTEGRKGKDEDDEGFN